MERTQTIERKKDGRFLAQSSALATDGLIILPYAGQKRIKAFMTNPILTVGHPWPGLTGKDMVDSIAGRATEVSFSDSGMDIMPEFASTQVGQDVRTLVDEGILKAVSIRWNHDTRETEPGRVDKHLEKWGIKLTPDQRANLKGVITDYELLDVGFVMHGADPKALKRAADAGNLLARSMVEPKAIAGAVIDIDPNLCRHTEVVIAGGERPFGGYKDFDECVAKNGDKDDPKAYCAAIQKKAEGEKKEDEILTLASIRTVIREEVAAVMAEIGVKAEPPAPAPEPVPAATEPEPEPEVSDLYAGLLDMAKATAEVAAPTEKPLDLGPVLDLAKEIKF